MTNIKRIRESQRLSISFVSKVLNLTESEYVNLENTQIVDINRSLLGKIALLFGVDVEDLEQKSNNSKEVKALFRLYNNISSKDLNEIQKLLYYKKRDLALND